MVRLLGVASALFGVVGFLFLAFDWSGIFIFSFDLGAISHLWFSLPMLIVATVLGTTSKDLKERKTSKA